MDMCKQRVRRSKARLGQSMFDSAEKCQSAGRIRGVPGGPITSCPNGMMYRTMQGSIR